MNDSYLRAREARRLEGQARRPHDKVPTYQELLDEALDETFPASDPISPTAAMHPRRPVATARNERDWTLTPGAHGAPDVPAETESGPAANARAARQAIEMALPMIGAAIADPEVSGRGVLAIVVMDPARGPREADFDSAVLLEHTLGDPAGWDSDDLLHARAKARLSWETGLDAAVAEACRPYLLRADPSPYGSAVCLDGIVVGVSGARAWFDEAFATVIAACLRALAKRQHALALEGA